MSEFSKQSAMSRREVLQSATAAAMCVIGCDHADAQQSVPQNFQKALDDPEIEHGVVEFQGGEERINGYLSRPKAKGKYASVLVITGNSIAEEYIRNTTAMLAQAGFVGFAPDIFWMQKEGMTAEEKRQVFVDKITDSVIYADLHASVKFLRTNPFVKRGRTGIMGFCFGGRCALMFATQSKEIAAVVPFYGNLKTPAFAKRTKDPVDVVNRIHAAVQGHYSTSDSEIPIPQLEQFGRDLEQNKTKAELFTYDAPHGFFAYTRPTYRADSAKLAWERTVDFLHRKLGK